jgi:hypothetical protein
MLVSLEMIISQLIFRMHLASSKWSRKRRVAYIHVGEPFVLGRCEQHTTRTTIVLAFWQIYDAAIPIMAGTT